MKTPLPIHPINTCIDITYMQTILAYISLIVGVSLLLIAFVMAKALIRIKKLNISTATCSSDFQESGIYIKHGMVSTENGVIPTSIPSNSFIKLLI